MAHALPTIRTQSPTRPTHAVVVRAHKHGWQRWAMHRFVVGKLRRAFRSILVQGLEPLRTELRSDRQGTLFIANHSSWWDLFTLHLLSETIPVDGYLMTAHFNMLRFGALRRLGAFSIDPANPGLVRESFRYAAGLLRVPGSAVWMCPQGTILGNDARPLGFRDGLRVLLACAGTLRIVPMALRYEFWQDERPHAFARFGSPQLFDRDERVSIVERCEQAVTQELDALRADVVAQKGGEFSRVLRGAGSLNNQYARLRTRFFGKTTGAPDDY